MLSLHALKPHQLLLLQLEHSDFSGKGHFSHQSTWDSKFVIFGFSTASALLSLYALKPFTESWTFPLAELKSSISLLPSSANTADSLEELG